MARGDHVAGNGPIVAPVTEDVGPIAENVAPIHQANGIGGLASADG